MQQDVIALSITSLHALKVFRVSFIHSNQIKECYYHKLAHISHLNPQNMNKMQKSKGLKRVVMGLNVLNEKERFTKEKEIKTRRMNSLNELMISKCLFLLKLLRMLHFSILTFFFFFSTRKPLFVIFV